VGSPTEVRFIKRGGCHSSNGPRKKKKRAFTQRAFKTTVKQNPRCNNCRKPLKGENSLESGRGVSWGGVGNPGGASIEDKGESEHESLTVPRGQLPRSDIQKRPVEIWFKSSKKGRCIGLVPANSHQRRIWRKERNQGWIRGEGERWFQRTRKKKIEIGKRGILEPIDGTR